jgi:endonuclease YncB( thermonuclease family)
MVAAEQRGTRFMAKRLNYRMTHRTTLSLVLLTSALTCGAAFAVDDMPAPKKAPRIKVLQQKLVEEAKGNRIVTGLAKVVEAERIKVGDTELRLFGIVLPQPAAPSGVESRSALEKLLSNTTVTCRVQERDKGWRLLGSCKTDKHDDISLAILQEGWAVVARGSVLNTDFSDIYLAAEAKAQLQRLGMWSPAAPTATETKIADIKTEVKPAETTKTAETKTTEPKTAEAKAADIKVADAKLIETTLAAAEKTDKDKVAKVTKTESPASVNIATAPTSSLQVPTMLPPETTTVMAPLTQAVQTEPSLAWLWFAGLTPAAVMILFGLGQIALRRYEYIQERKALAAALRGELMAARAICISRADTLGYGAEAVSKLSSVWPRLRSTIYQAYVGRIGLLGPDMARRVSSLYGQFSDYAQFYAARPNAEAAGKIDNTTVQQTLFTIIDHIEDTLNNLQQVEAKGQVQKRLLPQRQSMGHARSNQQLNEKNHEEKIDYVDAELVEDALAIKAVMQQQSKSTKQLADHVVEAIIVPVQPNAATSDMTGTTETIIATMMKQDSTSTAATTLATMTAAHDALKADDDSQQSAKAAAMKTETSSEQVPETSEISNRKASGRRKNKTKNDTEQDITTETDTQTESGEYGKEEYYDFRSQAVRIAK